MSSYMADVRTLAHTRASNEPQSDWGEVIRRGTVGDRSVQLLMDPQGSLSAKIGDDPLCTIVPGDRIYGIPPEVNGNLAALRAYAKLSHLVVSSSQRAEPPAVRVCLSLLGGGTLYSKAVDAYDAAVARANRSAHTLTITDFESAIATIDTAIKDGYTGEKADRLSDMLRDSYFGLAQAQAATNRKKEALTNFEQAQHMGHPSAQQRRIDLLLSLANAPSDEPTRLKHLQAAQQLGSTEATERLSAIEAARRASVVPTNPMQLVNNTSWVPWGTGFQLGKGIRHNGAAASRVVDVQYNPGTISSSDQYATYFISEQADLDKFREIDLGLSTNQALWHLQWTAKYVSSLQLTTQRVYCIIASSHLASSSNEFASATLSQPVLSFLQRGGFDKFRDVYGSHFIGGFSRGALFLSCLSFGSLTQEEISQFRLELEGSFVSMLDTSLSVENSVRTTFKRKITHVNIVTCGLQTPILTSVTNLEDLRQHYQSFRAAIQNPDTLGPVQAICEPWISIPAVQDCLNTGPENTSLVGILNNRHVNLQANPDRQMLENLYTPLNCVSTKLDRLSESAGRDLGERFTNFINGPARVFVLLGTAGSGKSAFLKHIEQYYSKKFDPLSPWEELIPVRIELGSLTNPVHAAVSESLDRQGYTSNQVDELKQKGRVLLMLDGYDEGRFERQYLTQNLFQTNALKQWKGKVVFTGRLDKLPQLNPDLPDHLKVFAPIDENDHIQTELVEEAIICPFVSSQIAFYTAQFMKHADPELKTAYPSWFCANSQRFQTTFARNPELERLVQTPFFLQSAMAALPRILGNTTPTPPMNLLTLKIDIFRHFAEGCVERELAKKLRSLELGSIPAGLQQNNIGRAAFQFCIEVARQMQSTGTYSVVYSAQPDGIWEKYFGDEIGVNFLRELTSDILKKSQVLQDGQICDQYEFAHPELQEYFATTTSV